MKRFKKGQLVRVEQEPNVYWKGRVIRADYRYCIVRNINPNSPEFEDELTKHVSDLRPWDAADEVNI